MSVTAVTPGGTDIITVRGLVKSFWGVEAVKGVSFSVSQGEIFGFLGSNGAGQGRPARPGRGHIEYKQTGAVAAAYQPSKEQ